MRLGIYYYFGYELSARDAIRLIADAGFGGIMFWWGDQFIEQYGCPKAQKPELARQAGLTVENIHTDFEHVNLLWQDTLGSDDVMRQYIGDVDDCERLGIPAMVMHASDGRNPPEPNMLGIDRFKRILERAEQKGIDVAVENVRSDKHLDYVFRHMESNRLKFCYDSGHENCFTNKNNLLDRYGNRLAALHLHDNDGSADRHRLPGDGTIDWDSICHKLQNSSYSDVLTFEVTACADDGSPDEFLRRAYEAAELLSCKQN